ncbi:MAG: ABC transporter ATP-binding protein/permease [Oscillospiraceae bacterium]|nr:ABC transporter ATP-binding protein/permease [Oscillospiraceae bacterium]
MNETENKTTFRESIKLLAYGLKTAHKLMPAYFPCVLIRSLVTAAQPLIVLFFSARIINELAGERDLNTIILFAALTVGLTFILSVIRAVLVREINSRAGFDQALRRLDMLQAEHYAKMDFSYTEDSSVSEMLTLINMQAHNTGRGLIHMYIHSATVTDNVFTLIFACFLLASGFSFGGLSDFSIWGMVALALLFVFGMIFGLWQQGKDKALMQKIVAEATATNSLANYYYPYVFADQAAKDIRIYSQQDLLMGTFRKAINPSRWISFMFSEGRTAAFQLGILSAIGGGFYILVGHTALGGTVPVGSIVQMVGAITAIAAAVGTLISITGTIYHNAPFIKPFKEFLTLPGFLHNGKKSVSTTDGHLHEIEFRNVSFRYPGAEKFALQNLSLKFIPTERLAVVGLNGSGKTTMIKLLCRLYDPTEGEILLDGVNIKEYDYEQYTALFSVVFQDSFLFPLQLGQNVATDDEYDEGEIKRALENAGFSERLEKMPGALDTIIGKEYDEDGTQLSGGEEQKVALARALYKNAPIVVLDEPTAALDPIAEYEVYTTFDKTIGNKTAVFISHRLSSCRFCQRIAVFDEGKLIQIDTHETLLADKSGRYYELWEAQASHYRGG